MKQITNQKNARRAGKAASLAADRLRRDREQQISGAYFDGATVRDIISATGLSARTVREYCAQMELTLTRAKPPKQQEQTVSSSALALARMKW